MYSISFVDTFSVNNTGTVALTKSGQSGSCFKVCFILKTYANFTFSSLVNLYSF